MGILFLISETEGAETGGGIEHGESAVERGFCGAKLCGGVGIGLYVGRPL